MPHLDELYKSYMLLRSVHKVGMQFGLCGETVHRRLTAGGYRLNASRWSESEKQRLTAYYLETPATDFSISIIAGRLGRSYAAVAAFAKDLKLTNDHRRKRKRERSTQLSLPWRRWIRFEHPRGFQGHKHTEQVKSDQSLRSRLLWKHAKATGTMFMSPENRMRMGIQSSRRMIARIKAGENLYSRCKRGRRADLGDYHFRSQWEANYARYLNFLQSHGELVKWEYEVDTFWFENILRGVRSYTPDFKVWTSATEFRYDEVKGWMDARSKTKLNRMRIYYPHIKIEVIDAARYKGIVRTCKGIIKNWE